MVALRSLLTWAAVALLVLLWLPLLAAVRLFDRDPARYRTGRMFRRLGATITHLNPLWGIRLEGTFPDDPRRPYVVVANHQSLADIPVISRLPWEMKWVAKAELFKLPVVGWLLKLAGDIPVRRGSSASRAAALRRADAYLKKRCSVMFFPEGTRSKDGRVRAFRAGAFRLAIEAGVPVLPIAIDGTQQAIPKHGWKLRDEVPARVAVLEPIATHGLTTADAPDLAEQARQRIIAHVATWRGVPTEEVDAVRVTAPKAR